ncbi:hypothetical protein B296_00009759, partial [Ensete ventricosum]
ARKLEAQLDEQMTSYRRLVSAKPDGSENELESGIEHLLKQLQHVNLQMQTWVSSGGSQIISHTLTRHKEILQDLTEVQSAAKGAFTFGILSSNQSRLEFVNHILSAIKRKKSMDTIILSLVASVCTFLILIYWLSK